MRRLLSQSFTLEFLDEKAFVTIVHIRKKAFVTIVHIGMSKQEGFPTLVFTVNLICTQLFHLPKLGISVC